MTETANAILMAAPMTLPAFFALGSSSTKACYSHISIDILAAFLFGDSNSHRASSRRIC